MLMKHKHYLIATCCKERTIRREKMEIIEIGAVMVDAKYGLFNALYNW